ncbi:hypothetical protein OA067_03725 [Gammaproteobacteria bacterium]|nr:hypothetical protein [Gammaproteobacteria bacterium]
MRAFAVRSGVKVVIHQPMRPKNKINGSFLTALDLAKASGEKRGVIYSKRRNDTEKSKDGLALSWRIEKKSDDNWYWQDDLSLKDFELFRSWIEKSVPNLPQDAYLVEEQNGYIYLTWLETLPRSEMLVIDFLDKCANFKFE